MTLFVKGMDGYSPGPGSCAETIYCSLNTSCLASKDVVRGTGYQINVPTLVSQDSGRGH